MLRKLTTCLAGVASVLLVLEVLCRVLPVSTSTETGYHIDPMILTYPSRHRWKAAYGWDLRNAQVLEANNLGFAAHRDFVWNERAVALIGDSFVEASALEAADRPGVQLERMLNSQPVYAMGVPGTALLDYGERVRYAHEKLGVRNFVIFMERGDINQSLCGSGNVNGPCLDPKTLAPRIETLPPADATKRLLRRSALAQYLTTQLRVTPQSLLNQLKPKWLQAPPHGPAKPATPIVSAALKADSSILAVDIVAKAFFEKIKPHVHGKLVLIVDSDRVAMYNQTLQPDPARQRFIQLAKEAGAVVVDTESIYAAYLSRSPFKLEVGPYDGHLNALGVSLIAQSASLALSSQ